MRLLGLVSLLRRLGTVWGGSWKALGSVFGRLLEAFWSDVGSLLGLRRDLESMFAEI